VPEELLGVGRWYEDFGQVVDDEVLALLGEAGFGAAAPPGPAAARTLVIDVDGLGLRGDLVVPADALGLVIFAHGSGSSRLSPRNRAVALGLQEAGLATLLIDLLAPHEEGRRELVFDIPLLAARLERVTRWARHDAALRDLPVGFFGASTGAGAALAAAAALGDEARAVVCRGGRPDLAEERLPAVTAPTLLIVGSRDPEVLRLNLAAAERLACPHRVEVVEGATHLFEEPGALEVVAGLAREWFVDHLPDAAAPPADAAGGTTTR
jgi:putative phosphoribosyl transferase